jgi:hypothetical protein
VCSVYFQRVLFSSDKHSKMIGVVLGMIRLYLLIAGEYTKHAPLGGKAQSPAMAPSSAEVDSLLEYTRIAASTVNDVCCSDALLKAVSGVTMLVIPIVQVSIQGHCQRIHCC